LINRWDFRIHDWCVFTREEQTDSVNYVEDVEENCVDRTSHFLVISRDLLDMNVERKESNTEERKQGGYDTSFLARIIGLTIA